MIESSRHVVFQLSFAKFHKSRTYDLPMKLWLSRRDGFSSRETGIILMILNGVIDTRVVPVV